MPVFTSSIEVTADYPTIKPSLNLNFARSRALDPRITFTRSTIATYVGRDGLIKYAGVNEPRFDHDPDTLESLGLLIEESRTNIALYSQEFNNVYWNKSGGGNPGTAVTANQAVAPDGTITADYIDYTTAIANSQNIERSYDNTPAGKTYTPISINAFFSWSMSDQLTEVASIKSPSFFDIDDLFFYLLLNLITIRLYAVDLKGL